MNHCSKCGAQIAEGARFCGSCGAAASPAGSDAMVAADQRGQGAAAVVASSPGAAAVTTAAPSKPMAPNVAGLVAYVLGFITGIFLLVTEPYKSDRFVRFHALQSIFVSGVYVAIIILWSMVTGFFLGASFFALWRLIYLAWWVIRLAFFALWLLLMYKAYNNERFELPIVGPLAKKHAEN